MQTKKIATDIDFTTTLQDLIQVYQEAAVMKMQKIRNNVMESRSFTEELSLLFGEVSASNKKNVLDMLKKSKKLLIQLEQQLLVFVAPDGKMSGDIVERVFQEFKQDAQTFKGKILVIGRIGKELCQQHNFINKYDFFDFPLNQTESNYAKIIEFIAQFDVVSMYHGQFINLMQQAPKISQIKGKSAHELTTTSKKPIEITNYLYEPNVSTVMSYFEKQIFAAVFQQRLHESELAQLGARIKAMEDASGNVSTRLNVLYKQKRRQTQATDNKKQLERLSGSILVEGVI